MAPPRSHASAFISFKTNVNLREPITITFAHSRLIVSSECSNFSSFHWKSGKSIFFFRFPMLAFSHKLGLCGCLCVWDEALDALHWRSLGFEFGAAALCLTFAIWYILSNEIEILAQYRSPNTVSLFTKLYSNTKARKRRETTKKLWSENDGIAAALIAANWNRWFESANTDATARAHRCEWNRDAEWCARGESHRVISLLLAMCRQLDKATLEFNSIFRYGFSPHGFPFPFSTHFYSFAALRAVLPFPLFA